MEIDKLTEKEIAQEFWRLIDSAQQRWEKTYSADELEPSLLDILNFVKQHSKSRNALEKCFIDLVHAIGKSVKVDVLEFCMYELRFPNVKRVVEETIRHSQDIRKQTALESILQAYSDDWDGVELYDYYSHKVNSALLRKKTQKAIETSILQPENIFTVDAYKNLLEEYRETRLSLEKLSYQDPVQRRQLDELEKRSSQILEEYRSRLPVYLLARCPICGGRVSEPIDTFSLNGMGWIWLKSGYGWYGMVRATSLRRANHMGDSPSYGAECDHVRLVATGVNLNCLPPDDVYEVIEFFSERPYVMAPLLELDNSYAVLHTMPVGRFDDLKPQSHYTAFFVTYFTIDEVTFDSIMHNAIETLIIPGFADYDLLKWVKVGKLFWLDHNQKDLPLMDGSSLADFPYDSMKGFEDQCVIDEGQIRRGIIKSCGLAIEKKTAYPPR